MMNRRQALQGIVGTVVAACGSIALAGRDEPESKPLKVSQRALQMKNAIDKDGRYIVVARVGDGWKVVWTECP